MSSVVGPRHGWDPKLLWLRHRLAAIAPSGPLAWEPPYAAGAALKSKIIITIIVMNQKIQWELRGERQPEEEPCKSKST